MSETNDYNQMNNLAAIAAFASLDFTKFKTEADIERALVKRTLTARKMLHEKGLVMRVLDSTPIKATIKSIELEESSQRYVVTFLADNAQDGDETIRTDRIDGYNGEFVKATWHAGLIGKKVTIYKRLEKNENQKQQTGKRVPPNGYRIAIYVTQ